MKNDEPLTFQISGELDPNDPLHQYQIMFDEMLDKAAPPEEVVVEDLRAQVAPDGKRVRVHIRLTMFKFRPHMVLTLTSPSGEEVARLDIIEPMSPSMDFTLHVRNPIPGEYQLQADVLYPVPEHMPKTPQEQRITHGEIKPLPPMRTVATRTLGITLLGKSTQSG